MSGSAERPFALVSGGSRGIGLAISEGLLASGYRVSLCARGEGALRSAADGLRARWGEDAVLWRACDVRSERDVERWIAATAEAGEIRALVNNAGIYGPMGRIEEVDPDAWEQAIRVNLVGSMLAIHAVVPYLRRAGGGSIVNLCGGGIGGSRSPARVSAYVAAKGAIAALTEALASELQGSGIRINAISPGAVVTRLTEEVLENRERLTGDFVAATERQLANGGDPVGPTVELVAWLCSAECPLSGLLLSSKWDPWREWRAGGSAPADADLYRLRRIDGALFAKIR
jgi:3-oxoacyl-[acyl-carrier protein] reductase